MTRPDAAHANEGQGVENPRAFPSVCLGDPGHPASVPGMELRDWFAGQAPHGAFIKGNAPHDPAKMAKAAYAYADAMLAARVQS
jgi:hypothetical protein